MNNYKEKYLKYKNKYLELKKQIGGSIEDINISNIILTRNIINAIIELKKFRSTNETDKIYDNRIKSLVYIDDRSSPLNFNEKVKLYNYFNEDEEENIDLKRLLYCFSLNKQEKELCKVFTYNESTQDNTKDIEPVEVKLSENGFYKIIQGRHRIAAHIINNNPIIKVKIISA